MSFLGGKKSLSVCILNEFFYPNSESGTGKAVSEVARSLADHHGCKVSVVAGRRSYITGTILPKSEDWEGISITRLSYPDWNLRGVTKRSACNLIFTAKVALKLLFGPKHDVVLVTTAPPFIPIAASILRFFRRTPFAYMIYDLEPDRSCRLGVIDCQKLPAKLLRIAQRSWLHRAGAVIAIGRCMKKLITNAYRVPEDKVHVVPVGASMRAPYVPIAKSEPSRPFHLVYSGNLGRYHDFESLLNCAKRLSHEGFEFTIVGNGAKRNYILERIRDERIDNVKVHEFLPEASYAALLSSADACFVTMEAGIEGTCVPSKFYSIMGAGRATLAAASSDSEVAYSILEHNCGLVVPPGKSCALEQALVSLKTNPSLTAEMGENGRLAYMDHYSSAEAASSIFAILRNLVPTAKSEVQSAFPGSERPIERTEIEDRGRLLSAE